MRTTTRVAVLLLAALALAPLAYSQTKISALPAPTGALATTDIAPAVQGGTTTVGAPLNTLVLGGVDQTQCLNTFPISTLKPIIVQNDGATPTGLGCALSNSGGNVPYLGWDYNVGALVFPSGVTGRFLGGASSSAGQAFQFCTGASSLGGCTQAFSIGSGSSGAVTVLRGLFLAGDDAYIVTFGTPPANTGPGHTCTYSAQTGGPMAGTLVASSTGACVLSLELPFTDGGNQSQLGLVCTVTNLTTHTIQPMNATGLDSFKPYCAMTVTQTSGDVLTYMAIGY